MTDHYSVNQHYGCGGILKAIEASLVAAGKDLASLAVDDLAPVAEFHTRGREATLEVAELADLTASDRLLDVGCGLGGTARFLAQTYGCQVVGVDLTDEYISVGKRLTELVDLEDQVELHQANALELPFDDGSFDIVWTEHVQMNIPDKLSFYSELARVLKPAGRFLFHDVFRGPGDTPVYPVPWAEGESMSALATEEEACAIIKQAGLEIIHWLERRAESIAFFEKVVARIQSGGLPLLGIHLLMGDNAAVKLRNCARNLNEDRVSVVVGVAHKDAPPRERDGL